jgi:hypothetical protein
MVSTILNKLYISPKVMFQIITVLFIAIGVLEFVGLNRLDQSIRSAGEGLKVLP